MTDPLVTTSVRLARRNGWQPGTHLTDGHDVIEVTGLGYEMVLARYIWSDDTTSGESAWTLLERDWRLEVQS